MKTVLPSTLTDAEREIYESVEIHGIRPSELENHIKITASTIRTHLENAREKLEDSDV